MAARTLPGLGLTGFWDLGSDGWKNEMDVNLRSLSALAQLTVISYTTSLPGSPSNGDIYIVPTGTPTIGNNVAIRDNGAWVYMIPAEGWRAWVKDTDRMLIFDGSVWRDSQAWLGLGGATPDATNRLSVNTPAALFNNAGSSIAFTLNKNASGNDASFTFQTAFSSRALFGLLGDDHFTIKTTPNGSVYKTGLIVRKDTAAVSLVEHPKFSVYCNFGQNYAAGSWQDMLANNARHNDQGDVGISSNVATFTAPHDGYYLFGAGFLFETPGTIPVSMMVGISKNNATPTGDTIDTNGDATITTLESTVNTTALLKLAAGDTVKAKLFFTTNGGRVAADQNYFWGCQIA